jgi:hypothetical protein
MHPYIDDASVLMQPRRMFNQQELQVLLGGVNTPIDFEDLRRHTNYGGLFSEEEPTIRAFWNVRAHVSLSPPPLKSCCFAGRRGFRRGTASRFVALRHECRAPAPSVCAF